MDFQLYNYQFGKIVKNEPELSFVGEPTKKKLADEFFSRRQEVLQEIFENDYNHIENKEIKFIYPGIIHEYTHKHLIKPTDGIIIMRIGKKKKITRTTREFKTVVEDNYPNCIVIIDNRKGIQRMAIEVKPSAFNPSHLSNIINYTLNNILKQNCLHIDFMHLQNAKHFWAIVNDKETYKDGFYRIKFHLPHLNLERINKKLNSLTTKLRNSFDSDLECSLTANKGGSLNFDPNDTSQKEQIEFMMEDLGGNSIILYSNNNKKKKIDVGKKSFRYTYVSTTTINQLVEDSSGNNLFGSNALDEIKTIMKEGID
ncbi:MAG: hypothetical protein J6A02_08560 [Prevotella sp.]|nr:hypothetical protein [Prevotella sp.]